MTAAPISRYPIPDLATLPDDIRSQIETVAEKTGFVPNVFAALAHRPDEFRAFFTYYEAVMNRDSALSKAEREMIVVATSAINQCLYCVISHGALLRIFSKEPLIADQIAVNYRKAGITERQKAMLKFACKVAEDSASLDEGDFAELEQHGFNQEDAWDIGAIAAFFALSNRMANLTGMLPNPEFYGMARG